MIKRKLSAEPDTNGWVRRTRDGLALLLVVALALPPLWYSLGAASRLRVDVGAHGDDAYLAGANQVEHSSTEDYRWTTRRAELTLPTLNDQPRILRLRAHGWRPLDQTAPLVQVDVADRPWARFQTTHSQRVYQILLPNEPGEPVTRIGFESAIYSSPEETRPLGFAIDWLELRSLGSYGLPNLWQFGGQALLLALLALLLWALALPAAAALATMAALGGALVWANLVEPLWVSQAIVPWLLAALLLLLATWLVAPRLRRRLAPWMSRRQSRLAWALVVAALGLRLAGAAHPLFEPHDVGVHVGWLETVMRGQLYLFSTPGEFQGRETFNPPGGYVLIAPLALLLASPRMVVQVGVALLDALGCLAIVALARELRLSATAALLALALYLALPINMTMLWWGFATNAIAQSLWLLLLWSLLRMTRSPTPASVALFAALGAVGLLIHVGALILVGAFLGLCLIFGWPRLRAGRRAAMLGGLALALLFALPVYFAAVAGSALGQLRAGQASSVSLSPPPLVSWQDGVLKLPIAIRGLLDGFEPHLLALAPLGLLRLAARGDHPLQRRLLAAWLAVCTAFFLVDYNLHLVTRYVYFTTPLACLAAGALLAGLWRWRAGRAACLALVLSTSWAGLALWVAGVLMNVKPSVVALTH